MNRIRKQYLRTYRRICNDYDRRSKHVMPWGAAANKLDRHVVRRIRTAERRMTRALRRSQKS